MEKEKLIKVVIEIAKNSALKYEINNFGGIKMDRVISSTLTYPFSYGFIPETLAEDNDTLDVVVISDLNLQLKDEIDCRIVGVLRMKDEQGGDEKILAIPVNEKGSYSKVNDLKDLKISIREKINLFFRQYKEGQKDRWSEIYDFDNREQALSVIKEARDNLKKQNNK